MMYRLLKEFRRRHPARSQGGFTLVELLVVIAILEILAAVVTMSMVGITKVAQDRAAATEKNTVQVAMDTMLADQGVPQDQACAGAVTASATATNDMSKFPTAVLWSAAPLHVTVSLYPHYLRQQNTHGTYYCTGLGEVAQANYTP